MLDRLRACAPVIILLLCVVVVTMRISSAHAHRHVAAHPAAASHIDHGHDSEPHAHHAASTFDLDHHDRGEHGADGDQHGVSSVVHVDVGMDTLSALERLHKLQPSQAVILFCVWLLSPQRPQLTFVRPGNASGLSPPAFLRPQLRGPPRVSAA